MREIEESVVDNTDIDIHLLQLLLLSHYSLITCPCIAI